MSNKLNLNLKNKTLEFFERKLRVEDVEREAFELHQDKCKSYAHLVLDYLRMAQAGTQHTIGESLMLPAIEDTVGVNTWR
jgi:hypothetical protein